jgi:hypothetical protein
LVHGIILADALFGTPTPLDADGDGAALAGLDASHAAR